MALDFPNIDPVALSIGPLDIRWYALAYLAGFLGGWKYGLYMTRLNAPHRPNRDDIDDFMPWAILGVILGGRLGYVLFYQLELYLAHPLDILKVWQGGMSFHGGVIGVIAALFLFSALKKIAVLRLADIFCTAAPIGIFFGRMANFINGELYGRVTDAPWGMIFPGGGDEPRHPSQFYEAGLEGLLLGGILCILLHKKWVRERPGILTGMFLAGYGFFRFIVEFFREPDFYLGLYFDALSMGQILSLPMILIGAGLVIFAVKRGNA